MKPTSSSCGDRIKRWKKRHDRLQKRISTLQGEIKRLQRFIAEEAPIDIDVIMLARMFKHPPRSYNSYCERWGDTQKSKYDQHYVIFYTIRNFEQEEF